jgi:ribonuclease HI
LKAKGWLTKTKEPVKNRELWERLDAARARHDVRFEWVRGHAGVAGNERADVLSQEGAMAAGGGPIDFNQFRY